MKRLLAPLLALSFGCGVDLATIEQADLEDDTALGELGACLLPVKPRVQGGTAKARRELEALLKSQPLAGVAVAVARGNKVLWLEGFGMADPFTQRAATAQTPFAIASVTKTVVAAAALQLAERGLLDLDADVATLSPALKNLRNPHYPSVAITSRMLLTHTATLWDAPFTFDATYTTHLDSPTPMKRFVEGYFSPGSRYFGGSDMWWATAAPGDFSCYSNMGIGALGVVVEEVSGQSLSDYVTANLFRPLGMGSTSFRLSDFCEDRLARGVAVSASGGFEYHDLGDPRGQPEGHPELASGMLKASASDLLRFAMAIGAGGSLKNQRVLGADSVQLMLERQLKPSTLSCGDGRSDPAQQALGFTHQPDIAGSDWVGHYGGMNGFTASMWLQPRADGLRYVVLMNQLDLAAMNRVEVAVLSAFASP